MRVLVVDSSGLLPWVVRHAAPPGVDIDAANDLAGAERLLHERPPDAVVVSVPPAHLPWCSFQHRCATARPPIPVLYESYLHASAAEAGLDPGDGYAAFLPKPAAGERLRRALVELLAEARRLAHDASAPGTGEAAAGRRGDSATTPRRA